jgi:hypothetical protein
MTSKNRCAACGGGGLVPAANCTCTETAPACQRDVRGLLSASVASVPGVWFWS